MNTQHRVSLADGNSFMADRDETLLHAAQRAHWLVRYGCRNGNCQACAATLLAGSVVQRDKIIDGSTTSEILLCLCRAQSDVQIQLSSNPQPGDVANAQRCYVRVTQIEPSLQGFRVCVALPAGRMPAVLPGQFALLEFANGDARGDIDHTASRGRELILHIAADRELTVGEYIYLRYPLGVPR
jgi:ferredoxin